MLLLEPIEEILPRRAHGYGDFVRRTAALARAGLPVPGGYALPRVEADALYARCLTEADGLRGLLNPQREFPSEEALASVRARIQEQGLGEDLAGELSQVFGSLRAQGAPAVVVTAFLVCDKPREERVLGDVQLGVDTEARLLAAVISALASPFDAKVLRSLRAADVRDAGVVLTVQRMVDGMVSGVVYTRHPLTGDGREWLVRAGYGLASAVRSASVPSDMFRLTRDGYLRDSVIADKQRMLWATPDGSRELRMVPEALVSAPSLSDASLREVSRLAERAEKHVGAPLRMDWALLNGKIYLLRADPLSGPTKLAKARSTKPEVRARELWSHAELGEALPNVLSPLAWSLLYRFNRLGLASILTAAGVTLGASPELLTDVRGRPYLNLSALTAAVCRLPGLSPSALARIGVDLGTDLGPVELAGPVDLTRAALRLYDSHAKVAVRFGALSGKMAAERSHFAGLDARLLPPDAVERVLCDVEVFLQDAGTALMRAYGLWLATLIGFRSLFVAHMGDEALRLERDLLWGPEELLSAQAGYGFLHLGRSLARDPGVLAWVDQGGEPPFALRQGLHEFALKYRHDGMLLLDPMRPRWRETPERLTGAMRALLSDPLGLAFAAERQEVARGRRERAEREWKRRLPLTRWPLAGLLITRMRELTRLRESLLADTAQAINVIRDITVDASRRLSMRYRDLGSDSAFFLELDELHQALGKGRWDVQERIRARRLEYDLMQNMPEPQPRFQGSPRGELADGVPLRGVAGSGGAAEGRVFVVRDGSELARLPHGAVLVVSACDVGLCPVLPAVRAVISENGGMVSHGAMLASALGVPVVVGVPNVFARLRDGMRVRVDAERCKVDVLGAPA
ncbi:MAG: PEP/pyruvate-binding domain-containing protein [Myxococcales bacterium]